MASDINEITINYEEDGQLVVKELDKQILSRGSWTTIIFRYKQWERAKSDYGQDRFTIRRYRKYNDEYRQQSKFNVSSIDQAKKIIAALETWINALGPAAAGAGGDEDE